MGEKEGDDGAFAVSGDALQTGLGHHVGPAVHLKEQEQAAFHIQGSEGQALPKALFLARQVAQLAGQEAHGTEIGVLEGFDLHGADAVSVGVHAIHGGAAARPVRVLRPLVRLSPRPMSLTSTSWPEHLGRLQSDCAVGIHAALLQVELVDILVAVAARIGVGFGLGLSGGVGQVESAVILYRHGDAGQPCAGALPALRSEAGGHDGARRPSGS